MSAEIRGQRSGITGGGMMNILKSAAVIAAGLIALAGCQTGAGDSTAELGAIQEINKAWGENYNAGNAGAIADLYAEDAVLMPPDVPAASGREAILAFLTGDVAASQAAGLTFHVSSAAEAIHVSGDMAWQDGTFTVTDAAGTVVGAGKYLSVLQKKDGKWRLYRDTWNSDSAPAAATAPAADAAAAPAS